MPRKSSDGRRTRRDYLAGTGALLGGGLLAGCSGTGDGTTSTTTEASTTGGTTTTEDAGHTVSMAPVGEVTFESVPESWLAFTGDYADMGVALGQADGLEAIGIPARYAAYYYEELPGVSVDTDDLTPLYQDGTGKEVFYSVDADVHVIDPNFMVNRLQWSQGDVAEVRENVAPFFGNTVFTQVYDWHDYRYYSLYEAFEKMAELFDERERYEAFSAYHDEVVADVKDRLPEETPDVALLYPAGIPPESFYPYLVGEGTQSEQWRNLEVGDALAQNDVTDAQAGGATLDYEALLDIDPDAIAVRIQGEITDAYFQENVVAHMEQHEVASELTAVQEGRVFYGGHTYQGPIIHLFHLEQAAQGLYPDVFGGEQLFDRQRVADIVTGEFDA
ncbi:ABC transporter substrate-binding protein (plasmid) [Halarchaeum sp. CBA1220]|uniref:ABC transporter substrate-binding protein n=1 Tax=Halarchaeum sp. CBA1220 TaxID=1853682 RepID=UPI000F3AA44F|nr:ABC transporter substrate-binding protein [Halarchaeum sp. CBA1220]QLC34929.1 ABC transporter substrate-binding protein [Halarchaeum sp. CBA1220]